MASSVSSPWQGTRNVRHCCSGAVHSRKFPERTALGFAVVNTDASDANVGPALDAELLRELREEFSEFRRSSLAKLQVAARRHRASELRELLSHPDHVDLRLLIGRSGHMKAS